MCMHTCIYPGKQCIKGLSLKLSSIAYISEYPNDLHMFGAYHCIHVVIFLDILKFCYLEEKKYNEELK